MRGDWRYLEGRKHYDRAELKAATGKPSDALPDYIRAFAVLQEAREIDPLNHNAYLYEGLAHMRFAEITPAVRKAFWESALDRFTRGHRVHPQFPYLAMYAGEVTDYLARYDKARFAEAEAWHQKALEWGSGNRQVNYIYGDHLLMTRQWQKAMDYYVPTLHKNRGWLRAEIQSKIDVCVEMILKERTASDEALKTGPK